MPGDLPALIAAGGLRIRRIEPARPVAPGVGVVLAAARAARLAGTMARRRR